MLATMHGEANVEQAQQICDTFNHVLHGDPIGSSFNVVHLDSGDLGYSVGKTLNNPELCDFICFQSCCYLIVLMARMTACFPGKGIHGKGNLAQQKCSNSHYEFDKTYPV